MSSETGPETSTSRWSRRARRLLPGLEILAIVLWAIAFCRPYLNFDPAEVPAGYEYPSTIQSAHIWTRARQCGLCALWNGSLRGGAPAFADPLGPHLHPLVILTTLAAGVANGSKLAILCAFVMAGLAQWWLGRVLGLGFPGRMYGGAMAVVGGHLAPRMELGSFPMLFSAAACSVVFAPLIILARTGSRRAGILLAIALALAALSGQGYIQMGMLFSLPIPLLVLFGQPGRLRLLGRRLLLAALVAALMAAPLLLPFAHFFREFAKETDPTFQCAQEFSLTPLNLVVSDQSFYALYTRVQHRFSWPAQYLCYVGFLPVALAFFGARWGRDRRRRREVLFLCLLVLAALWFASREPIVWMFSHSPPPLQRFLSGIRFPFYFVTLAVPAILALAAMGLERLVRAARVLTLQSSWKQRLAGIGLAAVALFAALLSLRSGWNFGRQFLATVPYPPAITEELEALRTPDLQWVNPPFGEHAYNEIAARMGLKLSHGVRFWDWKGRTLPEPSLGVSRQEIPRGMKLVGRLPSGVSIYQAGPGREYATLTQEDGTRVVCAAHGTGGDIDVTCAGTRGGELRVLENSWTGWRAAVDGRGTSLLAGQWISLNLTPGKHRVELRYRPWDVPIGALLCLAGVCLAALVWRRESPRSAASVQEGVEAPEKEPISPAIRNDQVAEGIQSDSGR